MMKNAFCFMLKALFVLKIFNFLTSWTGKQTIAVYILPNILYTLPKKTYCPKNYNQKMKFGQLKKHNGRKIFLQNSCSKLDKEASFRRLSVFNSRPGQIALPMLIGRARTCKTSETRPIFRARTFCLL